MGSALRGKDFLTEKRKTRFYVVRLGKSTHFHGSVLIKVGKVLIAQRKRMSKKGYFAGGGEHGLCRAGYVTSRPYGQHASSEQKKKRQRHSKWCHPTDGRMR